MSCQDISTIFQSRKELLMKHIQSLAGAILLASSCLSHAAVVNTIDAGAAVSSAISPLGQYSNAPVSENGFTWTSTYVNSVYGWSTSPYILGANGQWDGKAFNYAGLNYGYDPNDHNQHMKFTFDTPVSSVLAFLNYAPGSGNPYMAIFDSNDNLIDQHFLSISTPNAKNGGQNRGIVRLARLWRLLDNYAGAIQTRVHTPLCRRIIIGRLFCNRSQHRDHQTRVGFHGRELAR